MKRAIKPKVNFSGATRSVQNDSDDEALKLALELSLIETDGRGSTSSNQTDKEGSDFKRAIELSLRSSGRAENDVSSKSIASTEFVHNKGLINETIEISDEYDSMCAENSQLKERLTTKQDTSSSRIEVLSDTSPSNINININVNVNIDPNIVFTSDDDGSPVKGKMKRKKKGTYFTKNSYKDKILLMGGNKKGTLKQHNQKATVGFGVPKSLRNRFDPNPVITSDDDDDDDGRPVKGILKREDKRRYFIKESVNNKIILRREDDERGTSKQQKGILKREDKKYSKIESKNNKIFLMGDNKRGTFRQEHPQATVDVFEQQNSRLLSSRFDSENEQEEQSSQMRVGSGRDVVVPDRDLLVPDHDVLVPNRTQVLSTEEVAARMRNVFESGLAIHFSGEMMEACKAVSTSLFPHQMVALAWMCRHENNETDGMRGGILADDMGLGKTLTVISLVVTNFWDGKPMAKPELGYTRPPFSTGQKGPGRQNHGKFKPAVNAENPKVGSKIGRGGTKKTIIGGLFDKFNVCDTDKENKPKFKFKKKINAKKHFIDDSSSSTSDDPDENTDRSEDEFDKMSKDQTKIFKPSVNNLFKKEELLSEDDEDDQDDISRDEKMLSMISTTLDMNPKLNLDGYVDDSSCSEEDDIKDRAIKEKKKRNVDLSFSGNPLGKKLKKGSLDEATGDDSDSSLPDVSLGTSQSPGSISKNNMDTTPESSNIDQVSSQTGVDHGLKVIIPPKEPAVRDGRRKATLLVCPASLIGHWVDQLHQHLHKSVNIKLKVHHGQNKSLTGADLESYDIVITTYGTLASEYGAVGVTPLIRAKWLRVVMDEGHIIKNHNSKSAKAAMSLDTIRRWIVSGTPIQNNLMELWSLVNWLNFGMYSGKSQMKLYKRQIERPCKSGHPVGFERLQLLLDAICLRRTKTDKKPDGSPLVVLPRKTIITREVEMSEEERLCYTIFHKHAQEIVGRYHRRGELLRNYAHIFALMMRLRQLCCHREIIKDVDWENILEDREDLTRQLGEHLDNADPAHLQKEGEPGTNMEEDLQKRLVTQLRDMIRSGVSDDCSVCLDDLKTPVITPCAHVFCRQCIERVLDTMKPPSCPLCRNKIDNKKLLLEAGHDDDVDEKDDKSIADMEDIVVKVSSSKVNAVLKEMLRIQRDCPDDKIVVVSQFTSFLNILQPLIKENNFSLVRLDGTMSHSERSETVNVFQSTKKNSPKVMLLSLKAGGVGLNLTAANHLLLLDPAWNPASEWQCFDRTHRLGQKKEVKIYKYITKDSIEEQMVEIQEKKKDLISGAFHMPAEERRRQRVDDIRNIFGI